MGNHRFRLSDMMPNSWFYKLRDMRRTTTTNIQQQHSSRKTSHSLRQPKLAYTPNRASYYIPSRDQTSNSPSKSSPSHPKATDTHFPIDPPRKSCKKARKIPNRLPSPNPPPSVSCSVHLDNSSPSDIIIHLKDEMSGHRLPPILTKPAKNKEEKLAEFDSRHAMLRRAQLGLHKIKVRPKSPKIEAKKVVQASRKQKMASNSKKIAESLVVVKKSADPYKDFKESMVEMITENDIRSSKELEELLACYLALNSNEYQGLIVKVFEEIWIGLKMVRIKNG